MSFPAVRCLLGFLITCFGSSGVVLGQRPAQAPGSAVPAATVSGNPRIWDTGVEAYPVYFGSKSAFAWTTVQPNGPGGGSSGTGFDVVRLEYRSQTVTWLGVALIRLHSLENGRLLITVSEAGKYDYNGDGDKTDGVVVVYDEATESILPIPLAVKWSMAGNAEPWVQRLGDAALVQADEATQGQDLNGDGDLLDQVLHAADLSTGSVTNLGIVATAYPIDVRTPSRRFVLQVEEASVGDLNGDGDALDGVLELYNPEAGTLENLGIAGEPAAASQDYLVVGVFESEQGGVSLNGDGDTWDTVLHSVELATSTITNLGYAGSGPELVTVEGKYALAGISEFSQGADLNGNGNSFDDAIVAFDLSTSSAVNTALAVDRNWLDMTICNDVGGFVVSEFKQGTDLNGNGTNVDLVPVAYDFKSGTTTNTGVAVPYLSPFAVDLLHSDSSGRLLFPTDETANGADYNGDGDKLDHGYGAFSL
ncbi:MAG TPA: hypothetical protein ENJ09_07880, partial [Planctomycetes bacterium]|nr:hypothetical protein [Planctomycetota bacterium]